MGVVYLRIGLMFPMLSIREVKPPFLINRVTLYTWNTDMMVYFSRLKIRCQISNSYGKESRGFSLL
jgi:hypothetical protein